MANGEGIFRMLLSSAILTVRDIFSGISSSLGTLSYTVRPFLIPVRQLIKRTFLLPYIVKRLIIPHVIVSFHIYYYT